MKRLWKSYFHKKRVGKRFASAENLKLAMSLSELSEEEMALVKVPQPVDTMSNQELQDIYFLRVLLFGNPLMKDEGLRFLLIDCASFCLVEYF